MTKQVEIEKCVGKTVCKVEFDDEDLLIAWNDGSMSWVRVSGYEEWRGMRGVTVDDIRMNDKFRRRLAEFTEQNSGDSRISK